MDKSVVYTNDGAIDYFNTEEYYTLDYTKYIIKYLIVDYIIRNKIKQSSLLLNTGNCCSFIVNIERYREYIILQDPDEQEYYIHFSSVSYDNGGGDINPMKKCSSYVSQLMDISNSVNGTLTHEEILDNMNKLTKYIMSFVDYIDAFDDGYVFCNTKSA